MTAQEAYDAGYADSGIYVARASTMFLPYSLGFSDWLNGKRPRFVRSLPGGRIEAFERGGKPIQYIATNGRPTVYA